MSGSLHGLHAVHNFVLVDTLVDVIIMDAHDISFLSFLEGPDLILCIGLQDCAQFVDLFGNVTQTTRALPRESQSTQNRGCKLERGQGKYYSDKSLIRCSHFKKCKQVALPFGLWILARIQNWQFLMTMDKYAFGMKFN